MDLGILVIRVVVGFTMTAHGAQKVFGWFGGPGFRTFVDRTKGSGFRPVIPVAIVHASGELLGGLLFVLGFLTQLAAAAIIGIMVMAVVVITRNKGFIGGWELNAVITACALGVAFTGPGVFSLDELAGIAWAGPAAGLSALVLAVLAALLTLALRHKEAPA